MEIIISDDGFLNLIRNQNGGALVDELVRELTKLPVLLGSYTGKSHKTR